MGGVSSYWACRCIVTRAFVKEAALGPGLEGCVVWQAEGRAEKRARRCGHVCFEELCIVWLQTEYQTDRKK